MRTQTCPICGYSLEQDIEAKKSMGFMRAANAAALEAHLKSVHPDFWSWEQSKKRLGFGLGFVSAALTGAVLFYLFGFILRIGQYAGGLYASVIFVAFFVPYGLITRRGSSHFKAQWQLEGKGQQPTGISQGLTNVSIVSVSSDASILNLTNELTLKLKLTGIPFSSVQWQYSIPAGPYSSTTSGDSPIFRDQTIYFSPNIRDKLSIDDLKPLIAAALINYRGLRPRKTKNVLVITLAAIALYIIAWFALPPLFPTTTSCANGQCAINNLAWDVLIIVLPFLAVGLIVGNVISIRKFKWIADKEAAALFGKDQLITSLRNVSKASPADEWSVEQRLRRLS